MPLYKSKLGSDLKILWFAICFANTLVMLIIIMYGCTHKLTLIYTKINLAV